MVENDGKDGLLAAQMLAKMFADDVKDGVQHYYDNNNNDHNNKNYGNRNHGNQDNNKSTHSLSQVSSINKKHTNEEGENYLFRDSEKEGKMEDVEAATPTKRPTSMLAWRGGKIS